MKSFIVLVLAAAVAAFGAACSTDALLSGSSCESTEQCDGRNLITCDPATGLQETVLCADACNDGDLDLGCGWLDTFNGYRCRCSPGDPGGAGSSGSTASTDPSNTATNDPQGEPSADNRTGAANNENLPEPNDANTEGDTGTDDDTETDDETEPPPSPPSSPPSQPNPPNHRNNDPPPPDVGNQPAEPNVDAQCAPCGPSIPCPNGNHCIHWNAAPDTHFCVKSCNDAADCGTDAQCREIGDLPGSRWCHPLIATACADNETRIQEDACGHRITTEPCPDGCSGGVCADQSLPPLPPDDDEENVPEPPEDNDDPPPPPPPPPPPTCHDECRNGARVEVCDDGTSRVREQCENGCLDGSCLNCREGAASCWNDTTVQRCERSANGRTSYELHDCPSGSMCANGSCAACTARCDVGTPSRWSTDVELVCAQTGSVIESCVGNAVCSESRRACCSVFINSTSHGVRMCSESDTATGVAPGGTNRFYSGTVTTSCPGLTVSRLDYVLDFLDRNYHIVLPSSYVRWQSASSFEITGPPLSLGIDISSGERVGVHFSVSFNGAEPAAWIGQAIEFNSWACR